MLRPTARTVVVKPLYRSRLFSSSSSAMSSLQTRQGRYRALNFVLTTSIVLAGSYMALSDRSSTIVNDVGNSGNTNSFSTSSAFAAPRYTNKQTISMLSPAQVSSWLRENEESYLVDRDDRSEKTVQVPIITSSNERTLSDWMFWGVYDGHSGWTTSAKLRDSLITYVLNEVDGVYKKSSPNSSYRLLPDPETIDQAIKNGFCNLDDEIVNKSVERLFKNPNKAGATELIAPALSGSCGLLAFYDSYSQDLRVAVTGDSRAVLGSRNDNGHWTATALTTDQTGSNVDEANRVRSEHPGEESTAIRNGRVLGALEPTRAFGDARYKWTRDIQHKIATAFFGRRTPNELKSPPYVTAEPVVTTTKVKPERGDFMVIGSDGLFEMLSNEDVVSLVARWMESKQPEYAKVSEPSKPSVWSKLFGSGNQAAGHYAVEDVSGNKDSMKQPIRRRGSSAPNFVVEDENCATHLIRNALGGGDQDQVSMLVSIPSPLSRNYRDDLTVTVVFFGESGDPNDSGSVKVNQAATKNNLRAPRAKL